MLVAACMGVWLSIVWCTAVISISMSAMVAIGLHCNYRCSQVLGGLSAYQKTKNRNRRRAQMSSTKFGITFGFKCCW